MPEEGCLLVRTPVVGRRALVTAFLGGMSATLAESQKPAQNQDKKMPAISPSGCVPPPNTLNTLTKLRIYRWVLLQVVCPSPFPAWLGAHRAQTQQQPRCPSFISRGRLPPGSESLVHLQHRLLWGWLSPQWDGGTGGLYGDCRVLRGAAGSCGVLQGAAALRPTPSARQWVSEHRGKCYSWRVCVCIYCYFLT